MGGTQTFFQHFAENCVANHGDEVTVITTNSYFGPDKKQFKLIKEACACINGVHVKRFPFYRWHQPVCRLLAKIAYRTSGHVPEWINNYLSGPWSPQMINAITRSDADVILAGTSNYLYMQYPLYRQKLQQPKPFVFQGAIHFKEDKTIQVISRQALAAIAASEYYLANTHYEKNRLVEMGITPENIVVSGCGVHLADFVEDEGQAFRQQFGIGEDEILIAYIGRIEATKNIELLLTAFTQATQIQPNTKLIIAGYQNPDYYLRLQGIVQGFDEKLQQKINILTGMPHQQKNALLHAADIVMQPSVNESFGIIFLEAWACKKPVIGAQIGAVETVVDNSINGLLFQPNNAVNAADMLLQLISNGPLRLQMGQNGYQKLLTNYTWDIVAATCRQTLIQAKEKFHVY